MKVWKDAASLLLAARHRVKPKTSSSVVSVIVTKKIRSKKITNTN